MHRDFIVQQLPKWARQNPQVEVVVQPRPYHHPTLMSHYGTGLHQPLCVRNLSADEIAEKLRAMVEEPGVQRMRVKRPVFHVGKASAARDALWSPFREPQLQAGQRRVYADHLYGN